MKIKTIEDVVAYQLCCGCGMCAYADPEAYRMVDTLEYGRRPVRRDNAAVESPEAFEACPGRKLEHNAQNWEQGIRECLLPGWGPVLGMWEGYARDETIRFQGSSGGATTAFGVFALEHGKAAGVLHVIPRETTVFLNETVLSTTKESILKGIGSRYAPASPCDGLALVEQADGPCVIVGKPCDIAAVNKIAAKRPALREKIALTVSVFCAGTPSNKGVLALLRSFGVQDSDSVRSLRYRGFGWPGLAEARYASGSGIETRTRTYEQTWGEILQKYRQWRCYICPDHTGEFADISVGDPWYRDDRGTNPGQSLILARTRRGVEFVNQAASSGYVTLENAEDRILDASQPNLLKARGSLWGRLVTLQLLGVPVPRYRGFSLFRFFVRLSLNDKINSFLGTAKRSFIKKLGIRQFIREDTELGKHL